jgi:hypothetical protein
VKEIPLDHRANGRIETITYIIRSTALKISESACAEFLQIPEKKVNQVRDFSDY